MILLFLKFSLCLFCCNGEFKILEKPRIIVKTETKYSRSVGSKLYDYGWDFKERITPRLYIFEFNGNINATIDEVFLRNIQSTSDGQVGDIELITLHVNAIQRDPEPVIAVPYGEHNERMDVFYDMELDNNNPSEDEQYYGMGIQGAWETGYSGDGVVVAVSDVGVDVDHPDLRENINKELSFNFVGGHHVYPERFPNKPETLSFTDRGNRCCGLIAAIKTNSICNVGIAFNASIAVLKIFKVSNIQGGRISFLSDTVLKGLIYRPQEIDIYSNSWTVNEPFAGLTFSSEEVLSYGIKTGRRGLGSIYVFPVGQVAEGYTNSKFTIAVNSIGVNGRVPGYSEPCACVLTSAFGEGVNLNSMSIKTTSHSDDKCTTDFKGTSASAAMVSAMVGIALQANANLSWRDVQHIIVKASDHEGIYESESFKQNGAQNYYHAYFGFGLLNATKLVTFAKTWTSISQQVTQSNTTFVLKSSQHNKHTQVASAAIVMTCEDECEAVCVDKIEHVAVKLSYMTPDEQNLKITLISPSRTHSILMDRGQSYASDILRQEISFLSVNFWGENPIGTWILKLHQHGHNTETVQLNRFGILQLSLSISGTEKICIQKTESPSTITTTAMNEVENQTLHTITELVTSTANEMAKSLHIVLKLYLVISTTNTIAGSSIFISYTYIYFKKMLFPIDDI